MRNGSTKSVSLSVVKALASFAGVALQEIEKSCECVRRSNGKPIKIPVYTSPELASLVAHALADGSIGEKSTQVEYKNKRDECIQDVVDATKTVFSVEAQPTKDVSGFPMVVLPTAVGQVLVLAGAIQGNKTKKDFDVPPWILNGDSEIKRAFLRAMFDDEGSVDACCKWRSIKFAMGKSVSQSKSLYQFLNSIRNMLADFEINAQKVRVWRRYKVKDDDKLILGFWITGKQNSGKQNLKFFAQKIGFNHKIKQSKLTATLGTFKSIVHNKIPHDLDQDLKKKGR
jgi:intein/homing endonuclease